MFSSYDFRSKLGPKPSATAPPRSPARSASNQGTRGASPYANYSTSSVSFSNNNNNTTTNSNSNGNSAGATAFGGSSTTYTTSGLASSSRSKGGSNTVGGDTQRIGQPLYTSSPTSLIGGGGGGSSPHPPSSPYNSNTSSPSPLRGSGAVPFASPLKASALNIADITDVSTSSNADGNVTNRSPTDGGVYGGGNSPQRGPRFMQSNNNNNNNNTNSGGGHASSNSSIATTSSVLQGGAVGLWRVARDGHSPLSSEVDNSNNSNMNSNNANNNRRGVFGDDGDGEEDYNNDTNPNDDNQRGSGSGGNRTSGYAQRPATQGSPSPSSRIGGLRSGGVGDGNNNNTKGGSSSDNNNPPFAPITSAVSNNTSAPLLNMSLDAALMGGILREARAAGPSRASPLAPRKASVGGSGTTASTNTNTTATTTTTRSLSANAISPSQYHTASHNSNNNSNNNYLIPPLRLPLYRRSALPPHAFLPLSAGGADDGSSSAPSPSYVDVHPAWVTVVFDLDETLCNNRLPGKAMLRPGCLELLRALQQLRDDPEANVFVEIILWTASMECVARPVLERMDPNHTIFDHLIFRDRRWYKENGYTKDLRQLGRDLSHVVIIENSPMSVVLNRKHAILTKDFVGGGTVNYYYGGGPLNTRTSTGSPNDPSLLIVKRVLCSWATAVGTAALDAIGNNTNNTTNNNNNNTNNNNATAAETTNKSHYHDPAFTALPMPLGIVEFLRESPDISPSNEVILPTASTSAYGGIGGTSYGTKTSSMMVGAPMCGSPVRGIIGRGAGGVAPSPKRLTSPIAASSWQQRSSSVTSPIRRYR